MEHFLRPAQVQHQPIEIPYLCTEEYDNGPFVSYPERLKFDRAVRAHHVWCIEASADDIDSFNAFLQNWLGFGLMSAVFGRLVRSEEFTRGMMGLDGQPRRVLDSTRLVGLSRELITRGQSLNLGQQNANDGALTPVFQSARTMLSQNLRGHSSKDVDHKLVLFLSLLYENLFVVAKLAFGVGRASQLVKPSIPSRQGSDYLIAQLKEDGWCPREVQFLISRFNGSFRYFAIQLDRPGIHRDHRQSTCTALGCRAYNVDESNYFTAHTSPGCECEHVSIDSRRLIAILEKEIVPVVRCVRGEDDALRLVLVEATPGVNYVAISHVWSDGMGNPRANSMPACQIEHMHTLASVRFGEPVPFWIDTLCCPVEPEEATDRAIFLMRQTYADASHVIVVDSWLYRQESATLSDTERMARIALSAWTRRLWTFQEGILAKELWFRFADNLIDVDLIGQAIMDSHDIRDAPLKSYLLEEYLRLRGIGMPLQWGMRERLPLLVDAMQFRSTSVPTDEALCLGALLDLDMSVILAHSNEERMKALWSLVSNIPSSLIFLDAPKLPQPGFRWAPATLFGLNDSGGTFGKIVHGKTGGGLGAAIAEHRISQFEFRDGDGNVYWCECISRGLKRLLAEAVQRTIDDKSSIYRLRLEDDDLRADLSSARVALVVEAFDRPLQMEDAGAAILAAVKETTIPKGGSEDNDGHGGGGEEIHVQFACYAAVHRSRDPTWHPATPLAPGEARPVHYLTSRYLEHIRYAGEPYAGTLFEAQARRSVRLVVD